jgi:hypothetical protein
MTEKLFKKILACFAAFGLPPSELVFNAQRVANLLQLSKVEALLDLADASYTANHFAVTTEALRQVLIIVVLTKM